MKLDNKLRRMLLDPVKRRAWIHYQLELRGTSAAEIARQHGVTKSALYHAFARPYPKAERLLAAALGMDVTDLFPDRYDEFGLPRRRMGRPPKNSVTKGSKDNLPCNVKCREAFRHA